MEKILLIDDSEEFSILVKGLLKSSPLVITSTKSLTEAECLLKDQPHDVILLDWDLPDGSGPDFLEKIQSFELNKDTPVIMLTAHKDSKKMGYALEKGASDFISKPPNPVELRARLSVALRLKKTLDELKSHAYTDLLTGLNNRRAFKERFNETHELYRRYQRPFSLAVLDIDHFKKINDKYGHDGGDYILAKVAELFKIVVRSTDVLGRLGGEEFAILFRETPSRDVEKALERIFATLKEASFIFEQQKITVTVSAGAVCCESVTDFSYEMLFKQADSLLYKAKQNGRNQFNIEDLKIEKTSLGK